VARTDNARKWLVVRSALIVMVRVGVNAATGSNARQESRYA
jgi:hypothetical protein